MDCLSGNEPNSCLNCMYRDVGLIEIHDTDHSCHQLKRYCILTPDMDHNLSGNPLMKFTLKFRVGVR